MLLRQYELGAYAIMANHVHALLLPMVSPSRLLQSLKGATARQAESYDHWVRDESEWGRIAAYIEDNPVKAGLVTRAEDYRWFSAARRSGNAETSLGAAATSGCATTRSLESAEASGAEQA